MVVLRASLSSGQRPDEHTKAFRLGVLWRNGFAQAGGPHCREGRLDPTAVEGGFSKHPY